MRDTILIFHGTAGGGVGLNFEQKREAEIQSLQRRAASLHNGDAAALARLVEDARDAVHVIAFDVDATNVYPLNPPLTTSVTTWPVGRFVPCPMPGPDMVEHIKGGRHRGRFEYLNTEAVLALETNGNASGGARTNGWLAAETNIGTIDHQIRSKFEAILRRRLVQSRSLDEHVRVGLIGGSFGGFASGSQDAFRRRILEIARQMQVIVDFFCILLVPGTNASKDPENTLALTHGVMKELVAHSTRYHWHREKRQGASRADMIKSNFVPTIVLSDTNHAPGDPQALSIENFNGMVAELLRAIVLSDLGSRLEALWGDFAIPAQQLTVAGEPRFGRSAGISLIHLDRDRLLRFSNAKLIERVLSSTLTSVDSEGIARDVRAFFEARRFVEGGHVRQLAERLLDRNDGRNGLVDIDRFRRTYRSNTSGLAGIALLTEGVARLQLSIQQAGDLDLALAGRGEVAQQLFVADTRTRTNELARDRQAGTACAKQWMEGAIAVADNMVAEAAKDTAHFEADVARYQRRIEHFQNIYIPQVRRKRWLYRRLKRRLIEANAEEYCRCLEEHQIARMRQAAHLRAIEVLNGIREPLKARLAELQVAVDNLATERDAAHAESERVAQHRPDFGCPVGLSLIDTAADLEAYYAKLLPTGGEEQAVGDVHARLLGVDEPIAVASDPSRLHAEIERAAERTFRDRVQALHVVTEMRERFPEREQLGAVLRRRVHESFEYLQLRDSCDQENGLFLVRLLGIDTSRAGDLIEVLGRYDYTRGLPFQAVNTDDPERIVLLQFRAVFPLSEWAHFARSRDIYDRVSELIPFEKYHVVPGERALPTPGESLSDTNARVVAFKAWICERLRFDPRAETWHLTSADNTEMPLPLGKGFELLTGVEGYRRAVDVCSHYTCRYLARGPEPILVGLWRLVDIRDDKTKTADATEERLASLIDSTVQASLERELDWWRRNSVPAAMEWGASAKPIATLSAAASVA